MHEIIESLYEDQQFFYHSNHLGSTSWITDAGGNADQHLQYLPFGELLVDQRPAGNDIRFKFTGKERDSETGFDYFGARYYASDLSIWLSIDPIIKPNESPYLYCAGNPVILIDPNGMDWIKTKGGNYKYNKKYNKNTKGYIGKSANITVNDKDGNKLYSIGLNEDGSITNKKGVTNKKGFGKYDPKFKSGAQIISLPDYTEISPREKASAVTEALKEANNNGKYSINYNEIFNNFPVMESSFAPSAKAEGNLMLNGENVYVTMQFGISKNKRIRVESFPSGNHQVGPFVNSYTEGGYIKNGYWQNISFNRELSNGNRAPNTLLYIQVKTSQERIYSNYINE